MPKKTAAKYVVCKYPYNHPKGLMPVDSEVTLDHLEPSQVQNLVSRRLMKPVDPNAKFVAIEEPKAPPPIKLDRTGKPYKNQELSDG